MNRFKNKKSITILSIIFIISVIFIVGSVQAAKLDSRADLVKGPNIGNTIYMTQTRSGPIQLFKEEDHVYCIQHKADSTAGVYKVIAHADISGQSATIYTKSGSKTITSKDNVILAYICGEENYYKGYGGSRMRAIHEYLVRPWYKDVGFPGGIPKEWNDAGFSLDNHKDVKAEAESLIKNAKEFAKNTNSIKPVINKKQSSTKMNSISTTTAGPFKIKYTGIIESVVVTDKSGSAIDQKKISFSTDKEGKKKVNATSLKSNVKYYVHNSSNKTFGKLSITLKASKTLTAKLWFLQREDGAASQRFLTVDTDSSTHKAVTHVITIKPAVGDLTISKTDKDTGRKLAAGFKIQTPTGKWLSGTNGSYNYDKEYNDAQVYTATGGSVTLKDLKFGKYKIYEVKAADSYSLEDQEGYDQNNKWVYFGEATIGENAIKVKKSFKNVKKISIKGYVWIDVQRTKANGTNSLWDNDETKVAGVTVNLKNKTTNNVIATTKTDEKGEYLFNKLLTTGQLKDHYVEFNYNGVTAKSVIYTDSAEDKQEINEDISKYIPVAFNSTNVNDIKPNGSRALMDNVADKDTDLSGIASTYKGSAKENTYGLGYGGNLYQKLVSSDGTVLDNINLGLKKIPETEYKVTENLSYVKIGMKGYEYTYIYGGTGNTSRVAAPKVNWQNSDSIYAYSRDIYPSDIAYDVKNSTEELKVNVTYRIDVTNLTNHNIEELYKENKLFITNLTNTFDTNRYKLNDGNWTESNGTATMSDNYKKQIFSNGISSKNSATSYITFSVKHDALVDILNHPNGVIEKNPTKVVTTGYHQYTRKDYSWQNDITKQQTHITKNYIEDADAPYLIFKLGEDRQISGKVFEDKVVTTDGQKLGNGEYNDKENVVKDVKVELLDVKENVSDITKLPVSNIYPRNRINNDNINSKDLSIPAQVVTGKDGNYTLNGVVPGYYYLRFTYGDGTQKICDFQGNEIKELKAKDYKSTIITNKVAKEALKGGNDLEWYKKLNSANSSVAIDSLNSRIAVNQGTLANIMAGTSRISITIENTEKNLAEIKISENGQQADLVNNNFNGINLGIIEQPKQDVKFEKIITKMKLVNAQNNLVFEGNPEKDSMQGVTDLDGVNNEGSTYTRAELADDMISGANLELTYGIKVTNISDINYYNREYYWYGDPDQNKEVTLDINEISDYLDKTLQFKAESSDTRIKPATESQNTENKDVYVIEGIGKLYTEKNKARGNDNLKTSDTVTLVAGRPLSNKDDDMEFINDAEITKINNGKDSRDNTDGDKEIQTVKPIDNKYEAKARATVTPPTGENKQEIIMYVVVGALALVILSAGIVVIKKIVNK